MNARLFTPLWVLTIIVLVLCSAPRASAHEIRPALLQITEQSPGRFDVIWKVPMRGDRVLGIEPILPPSLTQIGPTSTQIVPGARIERFTCKGEAASLVGETIDIKGLSSLQIDVLLRLELADGQSHSAILRPSSSAFVIPKRASRVEVAWSYSRMGVIHILEGVDHLLFLVALLMLISGFRMLIKTVTAFTIAHSITLALATLGVVNVPSAPTEALIALSIVFLASEIVRQRAGEEALTARAPWVVAGVFGLFHGLGFAGALSEVGVPSHEVPLALLMFNVGVEIGQLLFVSAVFGLLTILRRHPLSKTLVVRQFFPYAVGSIAAFWVIERIALAFQPFV